MISYVSRVIKKICYASQMMAITQSECGSFCKILTLVNLVEFVMLLPSRIRSWTPIHGGKLMESQPKPRKPDTSDLTDAQWDIQGDPLDCSTGAPTDPDL